MNNQERQVIEELFARLADIEHQGAPRDPAAESFIRRRIAAQPGAPYYMAQTVVALEEALNAAQERIAELERRPTDGPAGVGSFLSRLFGDGGRRQPRRSAASYAGQPVGYGRAGYGGGFLAGAAQTALGVAGGVLLGNMIADAFSADPAAAGDHPQQAEPGLDEHGYEPADAGDMDFGSDI